MLATLPAGLTITLLAFVALLIPCETGNITLILNGEVYTPEPLGVQNVLIGGTKLLQFGSSKDVSGYQSFC